MANPSDVAQTVKLTLDREGALNRSEEAECFAGATDQVCPSWARKTRSMQ